jgi:CMP-N-acetylneuraminic acid synthetase
VPYCDNPDLDAREPFYIYNASIYAVKRDYFVKEKRFVSDKQIPLFMDKYHSTDVDDLADKLAAESYLAQIKNGEK